MSITSPAENEHLITRKDYVLGRLSLLWRYPSIKKNIERLSKIGEEDRESWGSMLEENAEKYPDNIAVKSAEANLTYREYNERVNKCAHHFISQGLKKGGTVIVFMENRPELLVVYSAIAKVGAINSMINTNLRKESLLHCLTLNPGSLYVIGEEVIDAFIEVQSGLDQSGGQKFYFVPDQCETAVPQGFMDLNDAIKDSPSTNPATTAGVTPKDTLAYVFTSGTTGGMPKAAVITHRRVVSCRYFNGSIVLNIKPGDTMYVPLPFFHTNALALSWPSVFANGAAVAIRRKFSVSNFGDDIRKYNATMFCYVGELCRYLMNQPPKLDDSRNPLKVIIGNGLRPDIWKDFKQRFGISKVFEIYGAAESNIYFVNILNLDCTVGTCMTPYAIVKYDIDADEPIRNENGFIQRVEVGGTGLMLGEITETSPFAGYTNKGATESKIFRDVFEKGDAWFNSGDLLRDIGYGHAQFVDRLGDTFRWKGENVSTTEVEKVTNTFPNISVSMAYGIVMPGSDGRAGMVAVISDVKPEKFNFSGLANHFRQSLPSYAVPKFIRFRTEFESTPTHKMKKVNSKREGFDPAGISDPLFVLLPDEAQYKPLTKVLHKEILSGKYKF